MLDVSVLLKRCSLWVIFLFSFYTDSDKTPPTTGSIPLQTAPGNSSCMYVCVCVFGGGGSGEKEVCVGECVCRCKSLRGMCLRLFCGAFWMAAAHLVQALLSIPVLICQNLCCPIVLVCLLVLCSKYGQSSGEEPLRIIAGSKVSVPLISRPVICYWKGGTTPKKLWSLAGVLFGIVIVAIPFFEGGVLFFGNVRHVY